MSLPESEVSVSLVSRASACVCEEEIRKKRRRVFSAQLCFFSPFAAERHVQAGVMHECLTVTHLSPSQLSVGRLLDRHAEEDYRGAQNTEHALSLSLTSVRSLHLSIISCMSSSTDVNI